MRILMLAQFYSPVIGGEERHVSTLSEALVARGHEVLVATMVHPDRPPSTVINGVRIESLSGTMQRLPGVYAEAHRPHVPPFPDPELALQLNRLIASFRPDVIHGHNWMDHSVLPLLRSDGPGFVTTLHDYSLVCSIKSMLREDGPCPGPSLGRCLPCSARHFGPVKGVVTHLAHRAVQPWKRRSTGGYIAVSHAVARACGITGATVPWTVLPTFIPDDLGANLGAPDTRVAALPEDGFLLMVGDINVRKGVYVLLEAYRQLEGAPPLVLIGRRCPDSPKDLPPNVYHFESWPHRAVMQAWSRCLFGLVPSTMVEPCGTVVMEANAVGKTTIASNHGGLAELVDHDVSGLHVRPGDAGELATAMRRLIVEGETRRRLEDGAREKARSFRASALVPRIEAIYRSVAAGQTVSLDVAPQSAGLEA